MTQSTAARQRAYKARKQAQGLVRVSEWVHKDDAALMRWYAKVLREDTLDPKAWPFAPFPQSWFDVLQKARESGIIK